MGDPGEISPWVRVRREFAKGEAGVLSANKIAPSPPHLRHLSRVESNGLGIWGSVGGRVGSRHRDGDANAWAVRTEAAAVVQDPAPEKGPQVAAHFQQGQGSGGTLPWLGPSTGG